MSNLINITLDALKKRLGSENFLTIQQSNGQLIDVNYIWNAPANKEELDNFTKVTGWKLPEGYKEFLNLHNGANLFLDDDCTASILLYPLTEIINYYNEYNMYYAGAYPRNWYMIGMYQGYGEYIFIDSDKVNNGQEDYLVYVQVGNIGNIPLNFETWLDRLIVCQGERFWLW
jgi:hypothetical protein